MARKKITEFRAKKLLQDVLGVEYIGISYPAQDFTVLRDDKKYVIKVDQGIKKRFKNGLIFLNINEGDIENKINLLKDKGYSEFLIEEYVEHDLDQEKYLSIERTREGLQVFYSKKGGIDIEGNTEDVKNTILTSKTLVEVSEYLDLEEKLMQDVSDIFERNYLSFLEINPLIINNNKVYFLDVAVEVDSSAEFFANGSWTFKDYTNINLNEAEEVNNVEKLSMNSQAALKLDSINKNGSIFLLLSGGGASVVIADEVYNLGHGQQLGNYGEYSGNPNEEETYLYTKNLLSLLLRSNSSKKVLIIGGGVANFTDIKKTFDGVIKALNEVKKEMVNQNIKIYVRRGGPNQDQGLRHIEKFLEESNLLGKVTGPELMLTDIVKDALDEIYD